MLCDICKVRMAEILLQENQDGSGKVFHICMECATKKKELSQLLLYGLDTNNIIYNMKKMINNVKINHVTKKHKNEKNSFVCPNCNWNFDLLEKNLGKLGCAECYKVFAPMVELVVEKLQSDKIHVGKIAATSENSNDCKFLNKIRQLERELNEAIKVEDYEKAATLRDSVRKLQEMQKNGEKYEK